MKSRAAKKPAITANSNLYDEDFFAWTQQAAALLRAGRFDELDVEHTAEEVEDMGKRDLKDLNSRLQVLLAHLLKWQLQPDKRSASWRATIVTQRIEIEALLEQSPSLRPRLASELAKNYAGAVKRTMAESGLSKNELQPQCPFSVTQILDEEFLPA